MAEISKFTSRLIKIVLTGAECSGKTTLANDLAKYFDAPIRMEYARAYLTVRNGIYDQSDIIKIARYQSSIENEITSNKPPLLICDTDFLVLKIWSELKYGLCDSWINEQFHSDQVDLYILPHFNIPYQQDPLREHPDKRHILFQLYEDTLIQHHLPHLIVHGNEKQRLSQSIDAIRSLIQGKS